MTDDPEQIRTAGRRARRLAYETRAEASALTAAHGVQWRSASAELFRQRLRDRGQELTRCAEDLDELDRLLQHHARAVESRERALKKAVEITREVALPW
ncbi:hypothetical protein [Demetria terragena]|uniref:hypothetical protein n=1 Tax=Demetria terragena TaxID=63959 RepID=UPI000364CF31|nr:hypothetical protein [Demetria terragena]